MGQSGQLQAVAVLQKETLVTTRKQGGEKVVYLQSPAVPVGFKATSCVTFHLTLNLKQRLPLSVRVHAGSTCLSFPAKA